MPLIDLKTNFKSLKYSQDRPGGGSSGQPYVQYPLPEAASQQYLDLYQNNRYNLDFPIRGGGPGLGANGPYITQAAKFDKIRIQKFLKDAPRGPIFILKQIALQLSNPKIQTGNQINLALGTKPFRFLGNLENTRIYNGGINTLAQVAVQGSGLHFERHGTVPINPFQQTYIYVADDKVKNDITKNRLLVLYNTKILRTNKISLDDSTVNIETLNTLGISRDSGLLFQYPGGPTSVGGIGLTTVHRKYVSRVPTLRTSPSYTTGSTETGPTLEYLYKTVIQSGSNTVYKYNIDNTSAYAYKAQSVINITRLNNTDLNNTIGTEVGTVNARSFNYGYSYAMLKGDRIIGQSNITEDFRSVISNVVTQAGTPSRLASTTGYNSGNSIENKYGIGSPGAKDFKRVRYNQSVNLNNTPITTTQDSINMLDVGVTGDKLDNQNHLKDLITFRFDTIEIGKPATPIVFRAFISSLQDNHSADHGNHKYVGRGETFYTYNGFSREVSFNFKVAAQSRAEMRPLYRKLNFLISQLYPDYSTTTGFMRAPLTKLTIGDYLYNQPGFLKNINVMTPDESPWEIANNQIAGADDEMYQLPQYLEVSCTFVPIHDFLPRRGSIINPADPNTALIPPFITPNTPGKNYFGISNIK